MLHKFTEEIAECYRHARECRERAERVPDPATKNDFFDQERRWLSMAHSYEFAERLSDFTGEVRRRNKMAAEMRERFKRRKLASITHLPERK
jgi:hypothetical protein